MKTAKQTLFRRHQPTKLFIRHRPAVLAGTVSLLSVHRCIHSSIAPCSPREKEIKHAKNLPEGEQPAAGHRNREDKDETIPPPPSTGEEQPVDPRYPFLLCHGLLGFDTLKVVPSLIEVDYWRGGIAQTLRRRRRPEEGAQGGVFISRVPSTGHVHERALCIKKQVAQILDPPLASKVPGAGLDEGDWKRKRPEKVNLVGHSMGGMDCRYAVSLLGIAEGVSSVTTIGTPHQGSPVANWAKDVLFDKLRLEGLFRFLFNDTAAIHCLTTDYLKDEFNKMVVDQPGVKYYSFGGHRDRAQIPLFWHFTYDMIRKLEGENDGLVSVKSCAWGEYIETLEADHLEMINWHCRKYTAPFTRTPYKPFNALNFYDRLASFLAQRGH